MCVPRLMGKWMEMVIVVLSQPVQYSLPCTEPLQSSLPYTGQSPHSRGELVLVVTQPQKLRHFLETINTTPVLPVITWRRLKIWKGFDRRQGKNTKMACGMVEDTNPHFWKRPVTNCNKKQACTFLNIAQVFSGPGDSWCCIFQCNT